MRCVSLRGISLVQQFISIAGSEFKYPIADYVHQLVRSKRNETYPDIPLSSETRCSALLILLLVIMVESYLARIRHFDKKTNSVRKKHASTYLASLNGCKRLARRFNEVYLLRNAIAHNHVFEYEQVWESNGELDFRNFKVDPSWQGERNSLIYSKYVKVGKRSEPRTSLLGLRVVPGRMGREDVLIVFETAHQILQQLRKKKYLDLAIDWYVPYQPIGHNMKLLSFPFWDLIKEIRKVTK